MGFLRNWARRRTLKTARLDETLWTRVVSGLPFLRGLTPEELARLRELAVLFLSEKEMHGAQGFLLTDEVRLSIALQACLPVLRLGLDLYEGWVGIVVYSGEFRVHKEEPDDFGVVHSTTDALSGEAWEGGPVVLSWEDAGMTDAGYNVVIHEFAHKIHMRLGGEDGFPPARDGADTKAWTDAWERAYREFCGRVDAGQPTIVDPYASEHPAEFFAVMSEMFFTDSAVLWREFPQLYVALTRFYRQDPAGALPPER